MPTAVQVVSTGGIYGAERVMLELAQYLSERGWKSRVLAMEGAGAEPLARAARDHGLIGDVLNLRGGGDWAMCRQLSAYLEQYKIDVVHSHGYKPSIMLGATRQAARRVCFTTCHSWYRATAALRLYEYLEKRIVRGFDHVFAVSHEIEHDLLEAGVARSNLTYVRNGLDLAPPRADAREFARAELGVPTGRRLVLRIGRLHPTKGNDHLVRAFAELVRDHDLHLAFIGDGETRSALTQQVASLGLADRVTFTGFRDNVADYLTAADLFVSPSLAEGLPMVLIETMAAGCPIVTTSVGAIPSLLTDGEHALLVPAADEAALRRAIERVLTDRALGSRLAAAARERYVAGYSRAAMCSVYLSEYERALAARAARRSSAVQ
jgi:glycosyltransferase involved in cell wall biosynthesis